MSWCAVDTKHEGRVQVQQLHHDAGPTLDSGICSAAAAKLHSSNQRNNNIDENSTIISTVNPRNNSVN